MATWTPDLSATDRHASIAAGVLPQSSCSLKPPAPARSCSHSAASETVLPLPSSSTLTGHGSSAASILPRCHAPGVTVVALLPSAGPVPPPMSVVTPEASASSISWGQIRCTWQSIPPAVGVRPLSASTSGPRPPTTAGGAGTTVARVAGPAERHDAAVPDPDVGLDHAPVVEHDGAGDDGVGCAVRPGRGGLAHRLPDHLAAAEDGLVAAGAAVLLDLDEQVGVGEPDPV